MVEIAKEIRCPFCGREIDGKLPDYNASYHCDCGAEYWPEAVDDITESQGQFLDSVSESGSALINPEVADSWEFKVIRNFDFLTDDEDTVPEPSDEWVLIFAKKKGGKK